MTSRLIHSVIAFSTVAAAAADWPHWRGPDRNGISAETGWKSEWPADGPPVLWKADVGTGFSSFSIAEGRAYTTGHASEKDTVFCFDAATGSEIWKHSYAAELGDKYYEGGTSATPTVAGGQVFHLSRWGDAMCLDAATGKVIWSKNLAAETGAPVPDWGFAGSPVLAGDAVLLNMGQHGIAVTRNKGEVIWKSPEKPAGYSTPVPIKSGGAGAAIFSSDKAWFGVDISNGKMLWEFPWNTRYGVNAADPILAPEGQVFVASGYSKGCALIKIAEGKASKLWENKVMRSQFNSCVLIDGFLYGPDGNDSEKASLKCIELKTGAVKWEKKGFSTGGVTAADGKLIALSGQGELFVAPVSPEKFEPVSEAQVLGGKCWTTPVLSNSRIYCRNATGDVVCLDVKK